MNQITVGETYTHALTGDRLKVIRLTGEIATCETETERVITEKPYLATNRVICNIKNLKKIIL